jgi:hypothetical protein
LHPAQFNSHNSGPKCVCTAENRLSDTQPAEPEAYRSQKITSLEKISPALIPFFSILLEDLAAWMNALSRRLGQLAICRSD